MSGRPGVIAVSLATEVPREEPESVITQNQKTEEHPAVLTTRRSDTVMSSDVQLARSLFDLNLATQDAENFQKTKCPAVFPVTGGTHFRYHLLTNTNVENQQVTFGLTNQESILDFEFRAVQSSRSLGVSKFS